MIAVGWKESIAENGFAVLPDVIHAASLDHLMHQLLRLAPQRSRAGVRHALGLPPVAELARSSQMIELAREVLGSAAFPFRATLFDKSPAANWLVVWHQDTALPLRERMDVSGWGPWSVKEGVDYAHAPAAALSEVLALRVSVDDSNAENGPLRVLPRTHTMGVLSDDRIHDLAAHITPVECLARCGGVVAMKPLVVHASSKSQSERPRRVLHIEYAASESIASPLRLAVT